MILVFDAECRRTNALVASFELVDVCVSRVGLVSPENVAPAHVVRDQARTSHAIWGSYWGKEPNFYRKLQQVPTCAFWGSTSVAIIVFAASFSKQTCTLNIVVLDKMTSMIRSDSVQAFVSN